MSKSRRSSGIAITLVLVAILAGFGWWYFTGRGEEPPKIQTTTVQRGQIIQSVTATGQLQPVLQTDVSSQISGRIVEVRVDYNTPVKQGDVLARIDPASFQSAVVQAENELLDARAQLKLVSANAHRSEKLYAEKLIPDSELDSVHAQLEQAEVQIKIREAELDSRKTDLGRCTITAPIDGVVIDRVAEVGKMVAASLNAPTLFTIVNNLSKMQINASVAEADIGNVKAGQDVEFTVDAFPNEKFNGRVSQIRNLPVTQQNVVVYATIIDVANERLKLKPGMTANVTIIIDRHDNVLRVPNAALRARVPQQLLTPVPARPVPVSAATTPGAAPAAIPAAPAAPAGDSREAFRAILREAGFQPGSGPPSPDVMAKARQIAAERGVAMPERWGGGGAASGSGPGVILTRTVYRLLEGGTHPRIEPVTIKTGIGDGSWTEVIEGLSENDVLVTSVTLSGGSSSGTSSPFGGIRRF